MYFVDSDGRRRRGKTNKCNFCYKKFVTRTDQPAKYCSKLCSQRGSRKRRVVECAACGCKFERTIKRISVGKSGLNFCSRNCKDAAQQLGCIAAIMPSHFGTAKYRNKSPRGICRRKFGVSKLSCIRCHYSEFECGIDVHHIDGDYHNNNKDNLLPLCAPCHRALEMNLWQLSELGL